MQGYAGSRTQQISAPMKVAHAIASAFTDEYRRSKLFYTVFSLCVAITIAATYIIGDSLLPAASQYAKRFATVAVGASAALATALGLYLVRNRNQGQTLSVLGERVGSLNHDGKFVRVPLAMLTFSLFMGCYLYWKMKITWLVPFSWDETFAKMDALLLGGNQGWEVLMPLLGHPQITAIFDSAYSLWAIMCLVFWIFVAVSKQVPVTLRNHYWFGTLLTWLVGLALGTALSSAGPVYYHYVTGDHELYAGLREFLSQPWDENMVAPNLQKLLWEIHANNLPLVGGISAMPSMHNAQALLFVLLAWHLGPAFRVWTLWFLGMTLVGSVHLGWHYLVDGLLAFIMVLPLWWIAGKMTGSSLAVTRAHQKQLKATAAA